VASGRLVGGAVVEGIDWQWIFWLNVPIGLAAIPLALTRMRESYGPDRSLVLRGLGLVSAGALGIVWGPMRGNQIGWTSAELIVSLVAGLALLAAFVAWERVDICSTPLPLCRPFTPPGTRRTRGSSRSGSRIGRMPIGRSPRPSAGSASPTSSASNRTAVGEGAGGAAPTGPRDDHGAQQAA
jgi:MFS family permease